MIIVSLPPVHQTEVLKYIISNRSVDAVRYNTGVDSPHSPLATLGQITDGGYLLLIPKRHVECIGAMEELEIMVLTGLLYQTKAALIKEYRQAWALFEHGIIGQTIKHAHMHVLPTAIFADFTSRVQKDFPKCDISLLNSLDSLREFYQKVQKPYLLLEHFGEKHKIFWDSSAPPQYLRIVVAEALGRPERANWRNMDPELDKKLWSETVTRLKPYF